ncbi:O-antigen/teichoic acid export membrane protein [Rhodococcus sp. 27YEA15]|uniref:lipopolysaccharide biosynthesis protein n=1 Tax=Rhodococcus sp. 27YEA15 TaxID=3156259 RepID=UPI003C7B69C6
MNAPAGPVGASSPVGEIADPTALPGRSLERNTLALAVSALITGMIGMLYWAVIARWYPAREVGAAAAVITTATMLSAFGNLSLGAVFERFLPMAGRRSRTMVWLGFSVGGVFGSVLAGLFLVLGPTDEMFENRWQMLTFPVIVVVFSAFALLDQTAVALREAGWAAGKNVLHALAKLVLALALAYTASRLAVIWTWTIAAGVGVAVLGVAVARRLRTAGYIDRPSLLPPRREIGQYLFASYGIYVVSALAPLMLPLIVVARLGADANAYFAISWSLVTAVLVLLTMLTGPYVAAAAAEPDRVAELTRKFLVLLATVCAGGIVLFSVAGPFLLAMVGERYRDEGEPLLRLAAVALVPASVAFAYTAIARVRRKLVLATTVQLVNAALILGISIAFVPARGLSAMGWAYIVAESVSAVILLVPLVRSIRWVSDPAQSSVN